MKLFKKKAKDEEIEENETELEEKPLIPSDDEEPASEPKEKKPRDLKFALIRCGAALIIAAALLLGTRFSAVDLFRGPAATVSVQDEEDGAFVKKEVIVVLANYASEDSGDIFAVVPMNGKLVTVNFTGRYQDSVTEIMDQTAQFIAGAIPQLDEYVIVQGTVGTLSEEQSTMLYDWFNSNKAALVQNHVISDAYDAADYLSEKVLFADTVNGMNQTLVLALSGLALLMVLYIIAELVLMALGFYKQPKTEAEESGESEEQEENLESAVEQAETVSVLPDEPAPRPAPLPERSEQKTVVLTDEEDNAATDNNTAGEDR